MRRASVRGAELRTRGVTYHQERRGDCVLVRGETRRDEKKTSDGASDESRHLS